MAIQMRDLENQKIGERRGEKERDKFLKKMLAFCLHIR